MLEEDNRALNIVKDLGLSLNDIAPVLLGACPSNIHYKLFGTIEEKPIPLSEQEYEELCRLYIGQYEDSLYLEDRPPSVPDDIPESTIGHIDTRSKYGSYPRLQELYRFQAMCFPFNTRLLHPFSLSAQPCRSIYRRHEDEIENMSIACCPDCDPKHVSASRNCGPNQCDFSIVTADQPSTEAKDTPAATGTTTVTTTATTTSGEESATAVEKCCYSMYVSISPAERAQSITHTLPFFRALKAEHIGIVVDIASKYGPGPFSSTSDYMSDQRLPFLKIGPVHNLVNMQDQCRAPTRWYRVVEFDGHVFIHYKITDWPDGEALTVDRAVLLNQEIDYMASCEPLRTDLLRDDVNRVCVHCNGGLGRAPTFICLRVLWNAAKLAYKQNVPRVCKWHHQTIMAPLCHSLSSDDKKLKEKGEVRTRAINLAAVLRNIIIRGYYTRSVFVQTDVQNAMLPQFAEAMTKQSFLDSAKHTA